MRKILEHLSRVTTSGKFISEIDGLRFIAIGTVVLFHLVVNLGIKGAEAYHVPPADSLLVAIARHGFRGVELFFIISGFILAVPFASHHILGRNPVRLRQYFLRRVTRLEPPYLLCMTLFFLSRMLLQGRAFGDLFPHYAASMVYQHNLAYGTENPINNVAWSLEIEIQFYLLVPLLARVFAIASTAKRRGVIVAAASVSILLSWLFIGHESLLYWSIARFLHFFLMGFLLADVFLVTWKENPRREWRWDLVSLAGWPLLVIVWNHPEWSYGLVSIGTRPFIAEFLFPFLACFLYMAAFRGRLTNAVLTNPWIATIGGMCYTMYLFHNQIIGSLAGVTGVLAPFNDYTLNVLFQAVLILPPMLFLVSGYFVLIEKPCMRKDWPKRLGAWMRARVAAAKGKRSSRVMRDVV